MTDKPNILFIFPDQHRADTMGCAGNPAAQTPNIDRIAAEGVLFRRCFTSSPLCMPARASLMNGRHVHEHGVWNNNLEADRYGPSHVRNIRDAGYHTAVIGKTHLYLHQNAVNTADHFQELKDWGFEEACEITGPVASIQVNSPYTDYLAAKNRLERHRDLMTLIVRGNASGIVHPWEEPPSLLYPEDHMDSFTARQAAEWLQKYQGEKPFYLQVCFPGPHNPFDSPAGYRARFKPEDMPLAIMEKPAPPVSPYIERLLQISHLDTMTESHNRVMRTYYYAKVALIDDGIGLILKALEERGFLHNTWIVYCTDHGEMLGDHRLSHKMAFYESSLRIPLIIRPPQGMKGWQSRAMTDHLDLAATLLEMAGATPLAGSEGRSLLPVINGGPSGPHAQTHKEVIFSELSGLAMVRTERYKLNMDIRTQTPLELYDMAEDPDELRNLVQEPACEKVRQELMASHLLPFLKALDRQKFAIFEQNQQSTRTRRAFD